MSTLMDAYILAGGLSSRFGSDKARALLNGQPLLSRQARLLQPSVNRIFVVADQTGKYADLGLTTIADHTPQQGPLGGLATALTHKLQTTGDGWILLSSCDRVAINSEDTASLFACITHEADIIAFHDGTRWEPLFTLYHTRALPEVRRRLLGNRRALRGLFDTVTVHRAAMKQTWPERVSVNTQDELAKIRKSLTATSGLTTRTYSADAY